MSNGTLLGKVLPEAKNTLGLVELVLQIVPAAIFVLKMATRNRHPPGRPAPQGARQLPGFFACAGYNGWTCCSRDCHACL